MNKAIVLRWINPVLLISAVVQAFTGIVFYFHLFSSSPRILSSMAEIHEHNGIFMVALVILHLGLNWEWFRAQFFKGRKKSG